MLGHPTKISCLHKNICNMVNNEAILKAIDDLILQETPNIRATAKKYNIPRSTLQDRFNGRTTSYHDACSTSRMLLTDAQETVLIEHLNKLSARGLHPTPRMVSNLVVEIVGHPIGGRWVERFCKRHETELLSIYLRNIDQARHIADNSRHFKHYFDQVSSNFEWFLWMMYGYQA